MHKVMPLILKKGGFDIEEYEEIEEVKQGGLSAKEYKKKMEEENKELNSRLDKLTVEYNNLVDEYNGLTWLVQYSHTNSFLILQNKKQLTRYFLCYII